MYQRDDWSTYSPLAELLSDTQDEGKYMRYLRHIHGVGRPRHVTLKRLGKPDPYGELVSIRIHIDDL